MNRQLMACRQLSLRYRRYRRNIRTWKRMSERYLSPVPNKRIRTWRPTGARIVKFNRIRKLSQTCKANSKKCKSKLPLSLPRLARVKMNQAAREYTRSRVRKRLWVRSTLPASNNNITQSRFSLRPPYKKVLIRSKSQQRKWVLLRAIWLLPETPM